MKALVCEMCGGSNLVKQEGVFVCQNCKTKYSVEEAKRMMIEGTVDVSGSTVKIDNTTRLDNLYKAARRARDEANMGQALKYYEQLKMEDPDNWEVNFFSAFYSAFHSLKNSSPGGSFQSSGGRVNISYKYLPGIAICISTITNCMESVFDQIGKIEDINEQNEAVEDVSDFVEIVSSTLMDIIDNEHSRMREEVRKYMHNAELTVREINRVFEPNDDNRDSYKRDVRDMVSLVESHKRHLVEVVGKHRIDEYWAANPAEKVALDSEKQSLSSQIAALENEITAIPGYTQMIDFSKQYKLLEAKRNSLGVFKGSEKKLIQAEMDKLGYQKESIKTSIRPAIEQIKARILPLESRLNIIDTELTKPR